MAIGIGSVSCTYLRGNIRDLKEEVDVWRTPGIDSYGAQLVGYGDSGFAFDAVLYDTLTNIETWTSDLEALQGTVVTAEDDFGFTYSTLLVTTVGMPVTIGAFLPSALPPSASARYRREIRIEGVVVGDL